jgi:hypothetical protein
MSLRFQRRIKIVPGLRLNLRARQELTALPDTVRGRIE